MKRLLICSAFALTFGLMAGQAQAIIIPPASQTIDLGTVYTGNIPDGPPPWLEATFSWTPGTDFGTLTLQSLLTNPDFVQGATNTNATLGWAFYLPVSLTPGIVPLPVTLLPPACTFGNCADNVFYSPTSGYNAGPVPGVFNLSFNWNSNDRFMSGDSAQYLLLFTGNLSSNPPFIPNSYGWSSVAHVQGINNTCSGWIVAGDGQGADGGTPCTPTSVPEPNGLGMFLLGLLGIGLFGLSGMLARRPH